MNSLRENNYQPLPYQMIKWFHKVKEIHKKKENKTNKRNGNEVIVKETRLLKACWVCDFGRHCDCTGFLAFPLWLTPHASCSYQSLYLWRALLSPLFPLFLLSNIPHVCKHDRICLFVNVYVNNTNKYIKFFLYSPINNGNAQKTDNIVSQKCLMFNDYLKASHETVIWYFERKWPQKLWCVKHEATCHIVPHTADRDQCWCLTGLFSHLFI